MKLTSLNITLPDGAIVALTIEQARALHAELDRLFGPRQPSLLDRPRQWPTGPLFTDPARQVPPSPGDQFAYAPQDPNRPNQTRAV